MRVARVVGPCLLCTLFRRSCTEAARAQKPAPVENVSSFPPRTPADEQKALHAPPGFEIQLVAAEPDINKPLNLAFDDRGRLWVTEHGRVSVPAPRGTRARDSVKILSNFQARRPGPQDRNVRRRTEYPDRALAVSLGREAIVHNIPNIYLMTRHRRRRPGRRARGALRRLRQSRHARNDQRLHLGLRRLDLCLPRLSPTTRRSRGSDHRPISMNSGNTYRMRADGSHAEYFTHGQVNPFGLAFDPLGNLYSCDCHSRPLYQLLRGAYYPSFGKPDDGLGFGPEMVTHDHGSTGIGGISFYAADQYPEAYRGTTFIGNVVTNRINHDRIEWHGSSPKGIEQPDFVWSEDNWFHPVDIELGPDGALYVADFYNRIIGHYEVPLTHPGRDRTRGRIWRIVYRGSGRTSRRPPPSTIDRTKSSLDELIADLGHPNLAVRITAANQLVDTRWTPEAIAAVQKMMSSAHRPGSECTGSGCSTGTTPWTIRPCWPAPATQTASFACTALSCSASGPSSRSHFPNW